MSISESHSGNNSINGINESNPKVSLNEYANDLKKCFISLKSERDISKLSKNKNQNIQKRLSRSKSNSSSFTKSKFQEKGQSTTPIEYFGELQDYVKKENQKKYEEEKEKELIKQNEERKLNEQIMKEKKKQEKIDLNKKKYEKFWKKVKYYIDKKNEHLSEITYKLKVRNMEKEKKISLNKIKMNKTSILLYPKSRKPLYRYKGINERGLNKELSFFYNFCQKELRNNKNNKTKSQRYMRYIDDEEYKRNDSENKYQKFYEKKLMWLKQRENKIQLRKKYLDNKDKSYMKSFSFKPLIDKKSINLVKQRNSFLNFLENKLNTDKFSEKIVVDKNDIYQKYLVTIKPYMSFYYERNSPFYKRNKKSFLTPNNSSKSISIGMIHINKGNNIRIIKEKNNSTTSKNDITDKNTNSNNTNKKNIFSIFKPDKKLRKKRKKKDENESDKEKNKEDKNMNSKLWWNKLNNINKKKDKKKQNIKYNALYQVNVREDSSWNKVCINNIVPKRINRNLLEDFL